MEQEAAEPAVKNAAPPGASRREARLRLRLQQQLELQRPQRQLLGAALQRQLQGGIRAAVPPVPPPVPPFVPRLLPLPRGSLDPQDVRLLRLPELRSPSSLRAYPPARLVYPTRQLPAQPPGESMLRDGLLIPTRTTRVRYRPVARATFYRQPHLVLVPVTMATVPPGITGAPLGAAAAAPPLRAAHPAEAAEAAWADRLQRRLGSIAAARPTPPRLTEPAGSSSSQSRGDHLQQAAQRANGEERALWRQRAEYQQLAREASQLATTTIARLVPVDEEQLRALQREQALQEQLRDVALQAQRANDEERRLLRERTEQQLQATRDALRAQQTTAGDASSTVPSTVSVSGPTTTRNHQTSKERRGAEEGKEEEEEEVRKLALQREQELQEQLREVALQAQRANDEERSLLRERTEQQLQATRDALRAQQTTAGDALSTLPSTVSVAGPTTTKSHQTRGAEERKEAKWEEPRGRRAPKRQQQQQQLRDVALQAQLANAEERAALAQQEEALLHQYQVDWQRAAAAAPPTASALEAFLEALPPLRIGCAGPDDDDPLALLFPAHCLPRDEIAESLARGFLIGGERLRAVASLRHSAPALVALVPAGLRQPAASQRGAPPSSRVERSAALGEGIERLRDGGDGDKLEVEEPLGLVKEEPVDQIKIEPADEFGEGEDEKEAAECAQPLEERRARWTYAQALHARDRLRQQQQQQQPELLLQKLVQLQEQVLRQLRAARQQNLDGELLAKRRKYANEVRAAWKAQRERQERAAARGLFHSLPVVTEEQSLAAPPSTVICPVTSLIAQGNMKSAFRRGFLVDVMDGAAAGYLPVGRIADSDPLLVLLEPVDAHLQEEGGTTQPRSSEERSAAPWERIARPTDEARIESGVKLEDEKPLGLVKEEPEDQLDLEPMNDVAEDEVKKEEVDPWSC